MFFIYRYYIHIPYCLHAYMLYIHIHGPTFHAIDGSSSGFGNEAAAPRPTRPGAAPSRATAQRRPSWPSWWRPAALLTSTHACLHVNACQLHNMKCIYVYIDRERVMHVFIYMFLFFAYMHMNMYRNRHLYMYIYICICMYK